MGPYSLIILLVFGVVIYLLYGRGLAVTKNIAAVLFVFQPGREADRVRLNSCTGWIRHIGRFRGARICLFDFEARLSNGKAEVLLLDRNKRPLLRLNRQSPRGRIQVEEGSRYYLSWEFQNATGQCELRWKELKP